MTRLTAPDRTTGCSPTKESYQSVSEFECFTKWHLRENGHCTSTFYCVIFSICISTAIILLFMCECYLRFPLDRYENYFYNWIRFVFFITVSLFEKSPYKMANTTPCTTKKMAVVQAHSNLWQGESEGRKNKSVSLREILAPSASDTSQCPKGPMKLKTPKHKT